MKGVHLNTFFYSPTFFVLIDVYENGTDAQTSTFVQLCCVVITGHFQNLNLFACFAIKREQIQNNLDLKRGRGFYYMTNTVMS
jgi:hypothetical protein